MKRCALFLRALLGRILAAPTETDGGIRNQKEKTKLQCLALLEKEPAAMGLPLLQDGVATGSTTFRWRALEDSNLWPLDS